MHRAFAPIFGLKLGHTAQQFEEWRLGWFCAPTSRYVLGLEAVAGFDFDTLPPTSSDSEALKSTVCRFFKRHQLSSADGHPSDDDDDCGNVKGRVQYSEKPPGSLKWSVERLRSVRWAQQQYQPVSAQLHLLESSGRAVCYKSGICDCLFPYRGHMCEEEDLTVSDKARNFRGAIHYIVNDDTQHILELEYALRNLEEMFNSKVDYPVLIFHDGLSAETRVRIVLQAPHRVWFFFVPDLVPDEIASARMATGNIGRTSEFGVGYIAQARFRSGPIFEHAGVQAFEYLWGLDSDSHIPNFIQSDPFQQIHSDPRNVMGYAHMTITSPTSVQTLWVHTVMYAMNNNIDLWSKKLRKWKDANMHFLALHLLGTPRSLEGIPHWNRRVVMTDCEILRRSFFGKQSRYWDYYSFLNSLQGFWWHRWGDHAVRSLGVGLALWEEDGPSWTSSSEDRTFVMNIPYAHQDVCFCGADDRECREMPRIGNRRKRYWTCLPSQV